MTYWVFMNPETQQIIKNDRLSNAVNSTKPITKSKIKVCPGIWIPVVDYIDSEFTYLWVFWSQLQNTILPMCAFVNENKAKEYFQKQHQLSSEWFASFTENTDMVIQNNNTIKMKKVKV